MFSDRLKAMRLERGLTLKALGNKIKMAESTISLYESGKREPDISTIQSISRALNVSSDYLLCLTDECDTQYTEGDSATAATQGAKKERPTVEDALADIGVTDEKHIATIKEIAELMRKAENNAEIANELSEEGFNVKYGR